MTFKTLQPPVKSNKQVQEYVQAVKKGLDSYFVVQNGKGWYVRKASNQSGYGKLFPTYEAALKSANTQAAKSKSEVISFDNQGQIISRDAAKRRTTLKT